AGAHRKGTREFRMPTHCPLCGTEVVKPEGEATHRCPNRACPSRGLETLIAWVEGPADIDGVGEQPVRTLWDHGLVRSLPELYPLTKEQLDELDALGEMSATNAIEQIEASRTRVPFSRVLLGLNLAGIGWVLAQNLARHVGDVDRLMAPRQSRSGSPTRTTAGSSRSCARSASTSDSTRASSRSRARSRAASTGSPERSS